MKKILIFVALVLLSSKSVLAQSFNASAAFGAREDVEDVSLSPDGSKVVYIAPGKGQANAAFVVDLAGNAVPRKIMESSGKPERIAGCNWVSNTRLVCNVYAVLTDLNQDATAMNRVFALDSDGSNLKMLSTRQNNRSLYTSRYGGELIDLLPGTENAVLMSRWHVEENSIGSRVTDDHHGLGVDRLDTQTLTTKRVVSADPNASFYLTDGLGTVRVAGFSRSGAGGYLEDKTKFSYRIDAKGKWQDLSEYQSINRIGFYPQAVDPTLNAVYGTEKHQGRDALFRIALDGSLTKTLVYAHPEVDVDGVISLGRKQRVIGVRYTTEKRHIVYFDPEMAKLASALGKAIPHLPLIYFMGASEDEQQLIIYASSDNHPGQYYHFNRKTKELNELFPARAALAKTTLATVTTVKVKAADGASIPAYLTLPPGSSGKGLPAIVMPHGGPSARDEWGFDWLAQFYANRGYAVIQPNFRGSAGYGDAWFNVNGFQSWKIAVDDIADSGRWLVAQGIADPKKLAIVGWSYGGYAALQAGVTVPDLFKAIVAIAPVTDLAALKEDSLRYADHRIVADYVGSGPHVAAGSPARHAERMKAPVLLFHGDLDLNVNIRHSRMMEDALRDARKPVELITFKERDHHLVDSEARTWVLGKSEMFLKSALGR